MRLSIGGAPAAADQPYEISVRAEGRLTEVGQFEQVVVRAGRDGALVRVRDIGRVELGAENYTSNLRFAGIEATGLGIQLLPTANALDTFDGVMAEMARLERDFPAGLRWSLAFEQVSVVRESINEVLKTLGATRSTLIRAFSYEYMMLGLATAVFALFSGGVAAWYVVSRIMTLPSHFLPDVAVMTVATALLMTVGIGLAGTWRVLGQKAAPVLREL